MNSFSYKRILNLYQIHCSSTLQYTKIQLILHVCSTSCLNYFSNDTEIIIFGSKLKQKKLEVTIYIEMMEVKLTLPTGGALNELIVICKVIATNALGLGTY